MGKVTKIFSEIASFFGKDDKNCAFTTISHMLGNVKFNLRPLGFFGKDDKNCAFTYGAENETVILGWSRNDGKWLNIRGL